MISLPQLRIIYVKSRSHICSQSRHSIFMSFEEITNMTSSTARNLRFNPTTVQGAKIIPFPSKRIEPIVEPPSHPSAIQKMPSACQKQALASSAIKLERAKKAMVKGQAKPPKALPGSHILARILWVAYIKIMLGSGLKACEASRSEYQEQVKKGS